MARFPEDQFDHVPEGIARVGAHRGPRPRGRGWIRFAWIALGSAVLMVAGLVALSIYDPDFELSLPSFESTPTATATPTPTKTVEAITDISDVKRADLPSVSVFDASSIDGAADDAVSVLRDAGWPRPATASTDGSQESTTIYYSRARFEGYARGIAELLGATEVRLSDAYLGADITVLIGEDYAPTSE